MPAAFDVLAGICESAAAAADSSKAASVSSPGFGAVARFEAATADFRAS